MEAPPSPPRRRPGKEGPTPPTHDVLPLLDALRWSIGTGLELKSPEDTRRLGMVAVSPIESNNNRHSSHVGIIAMMPRAGAGIVVYGPYMIANDGSLTQLEYLSRVDTGVPTADFVDMLTRITEARKKPIPNKLSLVPAEMRVGITGTGRFFRAAPATRARGVPGLTVGNSIELSERISAAPTDTVLLHIIAGYPGGLRSIGATEFNPGLLNAGFWDLSGAASHRWVFAYKRNTGTLELLLIQPLSSTLPSYIIDPPLTITRASTGVAVDTILGLRGFRIYTPTFALRKDSPLRDGSWSTVTRLGAERIQLTNIDSSPLVAQEPPTSQIVLSLPTTELAKTLPELNAAKRRIEELNVAIAAHVEQNKRRLADSKQLENALNECRADAKVLESELREARAKYDEASAKHQSDATRFDEQYAKLEASLNDAIADLEEYGKHEKDLTTQLDESREAHARAQRERDELEAEVGALVNETATITATYKARIGQLEKDLKDALASNTAEVERLAAEIQQVKVEHTAKLREQVETNAAKIIEQEERHGIALARVKAEERATFAKLAQEANEESTARERTALEGLRIERENIADARARIQELGRQNAALQHELAQLEVAARKQQEAQQALTRERDDAQARLEAVERNLGDARNRLSEAEAIARDSVARAEKTVKDLEDHNTSMQAEIDALRGQVSAAGNRDELKEEAIRLLMKRNAELNADLEEARQVLRNVRSRAVNLEELTIAREEVNRLKGELAVERATVLRAEQDAAEAATSVEEDMGRFIAGIQETEKQNADLRRQLADAMTINATTAEQIKNMSDRNEALSAELADVKAKREQATNDANEAKARIQVLEVEAEVERARTEKDLSACEERARALREELAAAAERADEAEREYQGAIKEFSDLRKQLLDRVEAAKEGQHSAIESYGAYLNELAEISRKHLSGIERMDVLASDIGSTRSIIRQLDTRAMRSDEVPALFAALGAPARPNPRSVRFTSAASYRGRPPTQLQYTDKDRLSGTDEFASLDLSEFARFISYLPTDNTGSALQMLETTEVTLGFFYTQVIQPSATNTARALLSICAKRHEDLPMFLVDANSGIIDAPPVTQTSPTNRDIELAWREAAARSSYTGQKPIGPKVPLLAIWKSTHTGRTEPAGYIKLYRREANSTGSRISLATRTPADVGIVPDRGYLYVPASPLTGSARVFVYNLGGKRGMAPVTRRLSIDIADGGDEHGLHLEVHVKRYDDEWHLVAMFVTFSYVHVP